MRRRSLLVCAVVVMLVAPACTRTGNGDDGFRLDLDGRAEVVGADGQRTVGNGRHAVAAGDVIRIVDGDAVLELPGAREVWLRSDPNPSVIEVGAVPEIVEGEAVVVTDDDRISVSVGSVDIDMDDGAARVRRGLGVTVGLYRGAADVRAAGREFAGGLHSLRQLTIPATGLLPRRPVPIVYNDDSPDRWDRRFLGEAIDLGAQLDGRARGFTAQLGPRARFDADILRRVLPLGDAPLVDIDVTRTPGELLVGAAIAVSGDDGSLGDRLRSVFDFRSDGAQWGLVALDQRVARDGLLDTLDDAFNRSPLLFAAGRPPAPRPTSTSTSTTTTTTTTSTTTPDDGGGEDPPLIPGVTVPPPDDPPDGPPEDPVEFIGDLLEDLIGDPDPEDTRR